MAEDQQQSVERTPKGIVVAVPKRKEFFGSVKKAAKPQAAAPRSPEQSGMRGKGSRRAPPRHSTGRQK
jgi:hypothetical protein